MNASNHDVLKLALDLSQYAAAPLVMGYKSASGLTVTTPEWWDGLQERIAKIQPMLEAALSAAPTPPEVEPVLWYEAEERARGADIRHVIGSMLYSTRVHSKKPSTENPVWPLYTSPPSPKASWDADGNPLNLEAAARDLVKIMDRWRDQLPYGVLVYEDNLRKFLPEGK